MKASMFHRDDIKQGEAIARTFNVSDLRPATRLASGLTWNGAPIRHCVDVEDRDGVTHTESMDLYIVVCEVGDITDIADILYHNRSLAKYSLEQGILNAAGNLQFAKRTRVESGLRVSLCIPPQEHYHDLLPDIIEYYKKQGIGHLYIGIFQPFGTAVFEQYKSLLSKEMEEGYISIGWSEYKDFHFNRDEYTRCKYPFINSALHHSKSFDDLLIIVDMDEVPVSMLPTQTRIVDQLNKIDLSDICFGTFDAEILGISPAPKAMRLGKRFPMRCGTEGFYDKSFAVVANCDYVSGHYHGGCHPGKEQLRVDHSLVTVHHYVSFWENRDDYVTEYCAQNITSELSLFQKYGLQ